MKFQTNLFVLSCQLRRLEHRLMSCWLEDFAFFGFRPSPPSGKFPLLRHLKAGQPNRSKLIGCRSQSVPSRHAVWPRLRSGTGERRGRRQCCRFPAFSPFWERVPRMPEFWALTKMLERARSLVSQKFHSNWEAAMTKPISTTHFDVRVWYVLKRINYQNFST